MISEVLAGGRNWIMVQGDCTDIHTGMANLGDHSVHHVITDPPYEAEAHTMQRRIRRYLGKGQYGVRDEPITTFDRMSPDLRRMVSAHAGRIVTRWVLVFCQVEAVQTWAHSLTDGGLTYKRACVWIKPDGQPQLTGDRPGMGYETIVTAHPEGRSRWNGGGKVGVYTALRHQDHGPPHLKHPTVKPLPLMEALIRDFTDPGDVVVDPFAGSGSTGVAALRLGRRFIGWEVSDKYHALASKRLAETREQPELIAQEKFQIESKGKRKQEALDLDRPFGDGDFHPAFLPPEEK